MRLLNKWLFFVAVWVLSSSVWAVTPQRTLVELFWADQDRYVVVYEEEAPIALSRPGSPWKTTGRTFVVNATQLVGQVPVARLYNPGAGSHVMLLPGELQVVLQRWASDWILESASFFWADAQVNGACVTGVPLYRLYNDGKNNAPNHRFTTDLVEAQEIARTWGTLEGLVMCIGGTGTAPGTTLHSAGSINIQDEKQVVLFAGVNGELDGLCATTGCKVSAGEVKQVCFGSNPLGWPGKDKHGNILESRACAPIANDLTVTLPKTCNNGVGNWYARMNDNSVRWFAPELWQRTGIQSRVIDVLDADGKPAKAIEYGKNWYQPPLVTAAKGADGKAEVTLDFGSNCLGGFGGPLEAQDLMFVWNSNTAGPNGQPGWGINSITGSTKMDWLDIDGETFSFFVTIQGIACSDAGNITVYKALSGTGTSVVWDGGADGFGYAWFEVPEAKVINPFWTRGAGVDWDQVKFQIKISVPGC